MTTTDPNTPWPEWLHLGAKVVVFSPAPPPSRGGKVTHTTVLHVGPSRVLLASNDTFSLDGLSAPDGDCGKFLLPEGHPTVADAERANARNATRRKVEAAASLLRNRMGGFTAADSDEERTEVLDECLALVGRLADLLCAEKAR